LSKGLLIIIFSTGIIAIFIIFNMFLYYTGDWSRLWVRGIMIEWDMGLKRVGGWFGIADRVGINGNIGVKWLSLW
jgi:hypothetical protein